MSILKKTLVFVIFVFVSCLLFSSEVNKPYINVCKDDLNSIVVALQQHSAPAKNTEDAFFQNWLFKGSEESIQRCQKASNTDDIFSVLKFFVNGFKDPHIDVYTNTNNNSNKGSISSNREFGISNLGRGAWIKIPTFAPRNDKEVDELQKILQSIKSLRNKEFIVFDLSGNGGGSSIWQRPLLRNLWGDQYLRSLGDRHVYNQKWRKRTRISNEDLEYLDKLGCLKSSKKNQTHGDFFTEEFDIYYNQQNLHSHQDNAPVLAKVFVLTDSHCASSCWLCVREILQIPGVIHIGNATNIQTPYSEVRNIKLPSGNFNFILPIHQFLSPLDNIGKAFHPDIYYKGDFSDKEGMQKWFLSEVLNKIQS